jgi:glycine hydroxymethyltransferase
MKQEANLIRQAVIDHTRLFADSLPMIASENLLSPLAKEMLISDLHNRYAEGTVGKRYYEGNKFFDSIEAKATDLAKKLFDCSYADVRPISGTVANLAVYFALTKPGDIISTTALADGGHISMAGFGALGYRGLKAVNYPFDSKIMNIDVQKTKRMLKKTKPKVALFGMSAFLFPTPIRELKDVLDEIGCTVWYDAAHVLGLIGGGIFQDPLREGVDVISASTHKTFPGPQHGIILSNPKSDSMARSLERGVFPGVTSNHHLHSVAALAVTLAEHIEFGKDYAKQIVANAKTLGQAFSERGINVLAANLGFTESHILLLDVSKNGGGDDIAKRLINANIVTNKNMLPSDRSAKRPSGIRLGTQELTRIGMKEKDMAEVADFFRRVIVKKEDPKKVAADVRELKKNFMKIEYCFNSGMPAFEYTRLVPE